MIPKNANNLIKRFNHLRQKGLTGSETEFSKEDLLGLFYHLDNIHAGKEKLFIPVSFAPFIAVVGFWKDLSLPVVVVAATVSIGVYLYHLRVVKVFEKLQDAVFEEIYRLQKHQDESNESQLEKILEHDAPAVWKLRRVMFWVLVFSWITLGLLIHCPEFLVQLIELVQSSLKS